MSKEPAYGIERAIYVIDTIINPNLIAILGPIFGHTLFCPRMNRPIVTIRHNPRSHGADAAGQPRYAAASLGFYA